MIDARPVHVLLLLGLSVVLPGCAAKTLGTEHGEMRRQLLRLYEEQLIDNLVRIKLGQVFVHMNYSGISGSSDWDLFGELTYGDEETDTNTGSVVILDATNKDDLGAKINGRIKGKMDLKAEPVLDNAFIYQRYRAFAEQHFHGPFSTEDMSNAIASRGPGAFVEVYRREMSDYDERGKGEACFYIEERDRKAFLNLVEDTTLQQKGASSSPKTKMKIVGNPKTLPAGQPITLIVEVRGVPLEEGALYTATGARVVVKADPDGVLDHAVGEEIRTWPVPIKDAGDVTLEVIPAGRDSTLSMHVENRNLRRTTITLPFR